MGILIRTPRLDLIPLTARELDMLAYDLAGLEHRLGVRYCGEPIELGFRRMLSYQYTRVASDPENFIWHTAWLIVRREDNVVVGTSNFKAPPDSAGSVEIGYGLGPGFCHNGYMTETVRTMCRYAFSNNKVTRVIAATELTNLPSMRVLSRCGFLEYRCDDYMWWYIDRKTFNESITNQ